MEKEKDHLTSVYLTDFSLVLIFVGHFRSRKYKNWEYILIGFYACEKIVKLTPWPYDDILFDAVLKPVFNKLPFGK